MLRVYFVGACGLLLAACTSGSDLFKSTPPTMTLRFESEPAGAEVKTSGGQTCRTPCALAVPATDLTTTFSLNGYLPQTVAVKLLPPEPGNPGEGIEYPARFDPNPVFAELVAAPPPPKKKPVRKPAPKKPAEAATAPAPAASAPAAPRTAPAQQQPAAGSPWPAAPAPKQ